MNCVGSPPVAPTGREFLESASWHSVTALAFWALNRSCPDAVPKEVHTRLRDGFRDGTRRNLLFAAELARVLQLFRQAGILAVPFKGPTLAWSLYEAPGLRYMSDLDVIVPEACADRALDLLLRSGYRQRHSNAGRRFFDREGESPLITTNESARRSTCTGGWLWTISVALTPPAFWSVCSRLPSPMRLCRRSKPRTC